uniref:tetratricopeptide repeat protein n=1 Tax=Methanobrevibacter sp. TaxID=66852 RepID=UPI00388E3F17
MLSNLKIKSLFKNAKSYFDEGDFDEALAYFDKILLLDNTNEEALYKKAFIFYKKSMYGDSINLLHRIIDYNPNEESFLLLGRLYFLIGDYENGMDYYRCALNEDVFNLSEYMEEILFFGGDWKSKYISKDFKRFSNYSLVLCDLIIDKYDDIGTKIWKAYKLYSLNCFEESLKLINEVINSGQDDYSVYYLKSANLIELTLFKEALDASQKGLSLNPEDVLLNQNKAIALYFLGNYDESFKFFKKSLDLNETTNSYFFLSRIELKSKNFKNALDYINKAIELQLKDFYELKDSSTEFYNVFINY